MSDRADNAPELPDLSATGGRTAPVECLRKYLSQAPPGFLEGALDNPALTDGEMILLLRNRQATPDLLLAIARDPRWIRNHRVKKGLVMHPRAPLAMARNLLPFLFWKELAEAAASHRVNPVVRRRAEQLLKVKIEDMSLGEKVALARRAPRGAIAILAAGGEDRVLRGLLGNPMLREMDAVGIASNTKVQGELLSFMAGHHRWKSLRSIRLALLGNSRTPIQAALRLLGKLPASDLQRLAGDAKVPKIISMGAERRLRELTAGERRSNAHLR